MESKNTDAVTKVALVSLTLSRVVRDVLLESHNNNILFGCEMLAVIKPNLSTTAGITAAVYINHDGFGDLTTTSRGPDIQSKTVFAKRVSNLLQVRKERVSLGRQICKRKIVVVEIVAASIKGRGS